MIVQFGDRLNF